MTGGPRSMVGPAPDPPGSIADCRAALDEARKRITPPAKQPPPGPSRSTACTHPYVEETADPDQVVCVLCGTALVAHRPEPTDPDPQPEEQP